MSDKNTKPPMTPRAKKYWATLILSALLGGIIGIILFPMSYDVGHSIGSGETIDASIFKDAINPTAAILIAIAWGVILPIFCVIYHKTVDEQEEHAFLWAGLIGWYAMVIVAPVWWILSLAGFGPQPHIMGLFAIGMIANAIVFLWKKFR